MAKPYVGPPMDLANMRQNGARSVWLYCDCGHQASVSVDALAADIYVPDVRLHCRCSKCGQHPRMSQPDWRNDKGPGKPRSP